jgi:DNA-binding transcriptional LysR family regulator
VQLDWEDVRLFLAIARAGSLTQAAFALRLSQPTLSRKLRKLEQQLGGELFDRFPDRMAITGLGQSLLDTALAMEASAQALQQKAQVFLRQQKQPLRISATMSVSTFLARHIGALAAEALHHDCEIDITPSRVPVRLDIHQADIAIRLRQVPEDGLLKVRKIGKVGFAVYGPAQSSGPPTGLIGLSTANRPPPHPAWVDAYASRNTLPVIARVGEYFLRAEAIAGCEAASLLPCFIGDADLRLKRLAGPVPELDEDAYLLLHSQSAGSPAARAVADAIARLFRTHAAELAGQTVQPPA